MHLQKVTQYDESGGCYSVSKSCSTLQPRGLQYARFPCPSLSPSLRKLMSIEPVMPSNLVILCHPLPLPPSVFSSTRVFSTFQKIEVAVCMGWVGYWFLFSYSNFTFLSDLINIDIPQHHIFIMSQTNIISPPQ